MVGGPLIREIKVPVQELSLKALGGGGLYARGGLYAGHYGTYILLECSLHVESQVSGIT